MQDSQIAELIADPPPILHVLRLSALFHLATTDIYLHIGNKKHQAGMGVCSSVPTVWKLQLTSNPLKNAASEQGNRARVFRSILNKKELPSLESLL